MTPPLWQKAKRMKEPLDKVKEESEKFGFKLNIQKTKITASGSITSWQIDWETVETVRDFILGGFQNQCRWRQQPWNQKTLPPWKKSYDQPRQRIKKQRIYFVKAMVFPVVMYGCESWTIRKAKQGRIDAFWTVVLEETLENPLDCKEIQSGHPKGNQSWIFIGRTDVEAETPILWPPDVKNWLIRKDSDAGKDWRR